MSSAAKLWKLLQADAQVVEAVPDGWKTAAQWAVEFGKSASTTSRILKSSRRVEFRKFRVRSGQVCRPIPHYRIKA